MKNKVALIIHGGVGTYDETDPVEIKRQKEAVVGLNKCIRVGWDLLSKERSALDVVEGTVRALEDFTAFNAGIGSAINIDKNIEMDASIMDGSDFSCGAVAGAVNYRHPISIARKVMDKSTSVFLAGKGVDVFAKKQRFEKEKKELFYTDYQLYWFDKMKKQNEKIDLPKRGTVGAVALDADGNIAAGTSTGGMTMKMIGRVGDSPIIGSGTYADNYLGGVSCTGYGEQIIKVCLAKTAIDFLDSENFNAMKACERAIGVMERKVSGKGGLIMITKKGEMGYCYNEQMMPVAYRTSVMGDFEVSLTPKLK